MEFESLLPTVGEMIKTVDAVKYISDVSANMNLHLTKTKHRILNSVRIFEERNLGTIHATLTQVVNRIDNFAKQKQMNTFKEI